MRSWVWFVLVVFFFFLLRAKSYTFVLVKWRYAIPHIEGNEGGNISCTAWMPHGVFLEYFPTIFSFINEWDAMGGPQQAPLVSSDWDCRHSLCQQPHSPPNPTHAGTVISFHAESNSRCSNFTTMASFSIGRVSIHMCVYVDTQIYIYMYPVPVLFQLSCFLYGVFVKDIEMIIFKWLELILRW